MKPEDRKRFSIALSHARVSLPGINLTTKEEVIRMDAFWEALKEYSIEAVEFAFRQATKWLVFFPKPVELINFILEEHKRRYLESKPTENPPLLDWMQPTEEGRKIAAEMVQKYFGPLKAKWEKEDAETEVKRKIEFEKRRGTLKKQSKIFLKKGGN